MVPFRAMRIENMDLINRCLTDSIRYARGCQREMIGAVIAVGIVRVLYEVWQWKKGVKGVERKLLRPFLTSLALWEINSIYVVYAFYVTLGMRHIGMRQEVNLLPFQAVLSRPGEIPLMLENILLFLPLGILLPLTFPGFSKGKLVLGAAGAVSLTIELLQYLFRCGKTELDDVILNMLGAGAGWLIFSLFRWMHRRVAPQR